MGKATNKKGLTDQQELFAYKVVELGDASAAYRTAYPKSENWKQESVWRMAHKLAKENIKVVSRIEQLRHDLMEKHELSAERVIQELARVAFFDIGNAFTPENQLQLPKEMSAEVRRTVASIETVETTSKQDQEKGVEVITRKVKFMDKLSALDKLAKCLGIYSASRVEVSGPDGKEITPASQMTPEQLERVLTTVMGKL